MPSVTVFSPAKLNLFLAITGRRGDGFHDLVSVAAPLTFGDTLTVTLGEKSPVGPGGGEAVVLTCDDPALAVDETNLVVRAARLFLAETNAAGRVVSVALTKRIPMGAGLGGGSSNATATLQALNQLARQPLARARLDALAAQLGSDCGLFLEGAPVVMRGRGERLAPLPADAVARLSGRRVLVFKPSFGISTVWAYRQMAAAAPAWYLPAEQAEARLAAWSSDASAPAEVLLFNNMEAPAFAKFVALPVLLEALRREFGLAVRMSGSGSACFALLPDGAPVAAISERIRDAWGREAWITEAQMR